MIANAVPLYIKVKNNDGKDEFIKIDEKITVHHEHTYELGDKATIISFISVGAMVLIIFPIALALTIKKIVSS